MPAQPETLLIPFKGGLDTYSNSHLLTPGMLTASLGTMLDRPGAAYPGPGYSPVQWAPTSSTWTNHGIGAYSVGTGTNTDQLVFWSTKAGGSGPGISVAGTASGTNAPTQQYVAPWRQMTQRSQVSLALGNPAVAGPPQCAVAGNTAFYVWLTGNYGSGGMGTYYGVVMVTQNLDTRAWGGPYYLTTTGDWSTSSDTALSTVYRVAAASDGTYFRVGILWDNGGSQYLDMYSYLATTPTTHVGHTTALASSARNLDSVDNGDEGNAGYGAFTYWDGSTNLIAYSFNSTASSFSGPTTLISTLSNITTPVISAAPIRSSTGTSAGFMFVATNATNQPVVVTTTLALASPVLTTVTATLPSDTPCAISIVNTTDGASTNVCLAIEYKPTATTTIGQTYTWNYVYLANLALASSNALTSSSTLKSWGGLALLGKFYGWYGGTEYRPLLPVRSGWYQTDGAWGSVQAAYPNGYVYDHNGQLWAKFGDADVGSDSLWPRFASTSYKGYLLQTLPAGFHYTLNSGQQTLTFPWPQYGYVQYFDTGDSDNGAPIGTRAGLSTVTWLAPTASEPAAPMVQFGSTLIIPGTITAYYDGSNIFEAGFLHRAPTPMLQSQGGGGSLPNATKYTYQVVLSARDGAGRIHRSAPSIPIPVTTTAANDSIKIFVPQTYQTLRGANVPITVEIYRNAPTFTTDPDEKFYLTSYLNSSAGSTTTVDTAADTTLEKNNSIYTYGYQAFASTGTWAPPPFDSVTVWNNQVWGVANRNGPELWCTWPQDNAQITPEGPAWSTQNRLGLPAELGQPKALVGLDEKLFILGTRADYGIIGTAPTRDVSLADNPSLFSAPYALPTPGGIKVLNGATRLPKGILSQGTQGFTLLGRDLQYTPVGVPVKDFTRTDLYLPGVFLPEQSAVLLFSATNTANNLVYFFDDNTWAQIEQPPLSPTNTSAAAVIVGTARAVAGQSSQVYALSSAGAYYYQIQPFAKYLSFRTPWIPLSPVGPMTMRSVAGYGYLREVHVLGQLPGGYPGVQTLTLYTEYDYANNTMQPPDTQSLTLQSGSQADLEYQWRFGFSQGNAKRVRFTVTIDGGARTSAGSTAPAVLLTGLMLSYDVDAGLSRLGAANSLGT